MKLESFIIGLVLVALVGVGVWVLRAPKSGEVGSEQSGVSGYIHMGPTCPVTRIPPETNVPPDPHCVDKPYANAAVTIRNKSNGALVNSTTAGADGKFTTNIAAGTYLISVSLQANGFLPRCNETEATVTANEMTSVDISCGTGIR